VLCITLGERGDHNPSSLFVYNPTFYFIDGAYRKTHPFNVTKRRVSVIGTATVIRAGPSEVRIPVWARDFLFFKTYGPALGSTQLPVLMGKRYKVKCTLVQALRLCTGCTAYRGSRGIALLFLDHGTRRGEWSAARPGRSLPPGKTRYALYSRLGGAQGRSGHVREISPPHRDSIPGPSRL